ncbi:MAG: U32 family peptidase [Erysipelotrichaceae bacterium]|nr:U32 family peptidase [Erysipelotrichaceae bacterium]MBR3694538.1 U32 family peptidase [Erysipelotrichales bacterium]
MKKDIELLAPAGDLERLKCAVRFGADAVYIGGKKFSLRSRASNFDLEDIREGVEFAHAHGSRVHVTCNMVLHNEDFEGAREYLTALGEIGVDAIICESMAFARISKEVAPNMEVHLSTQCSTLNLKSIQYYQRHGIDRVVLAREVDLKQMEYIVKNSPLPIEVFIHGAMCMAYSGRCMLSNHMTLRDANRGGCAQSCRWKYHLLNTALEEVSKEDCLFSMSSKDMMAARYIPSLMEMGVTSLKIEGRMKTAYYISCVVRAYRKLIDAYANGEELDWEYYVKELAKAENRPTCIGFYEGVPGVKDHLYGVNGAGVIQDFVATVIDYDTDRKEAIIEVKNHFVAGTVLEAFGPHLENTVFTVNEMYDESGELVEIANKPTQILRVPIPFEVKKFDLIRKYR